MGSRAGPSRAREGPAREGPAREGVLEGPVRVMGVRRSGRPSLREGEVYLYPFMTQSISSTIVGRNDSNIDLLYSQFNTWFSSSHNLYLNKSNLFSDIYSSYANYILSNFPGSPLIPKNLFSRFFRYETKQRELYFNIVRRKAKTQYDFFDNAYLGKKPE